MTLRRFAPALFCLVAFALAVPMLGARSLWGDEAFSVWASRQSVADLLRGLDAQPPLYHLLLKLGRAGFGESVFALRFVSVLCVVAAVPFVHRAARALAGPSAARLATLVVALSPMATYYAQEARMYAPALLFVCAAMAVTARGLAHGALRTRHWVALVFASLGALFSHFFTVPILAVNGLALLGRGEGKERKEGREKRKERNACTMLDSLFPHSSSLFSLLAAHAAIALVFGAWFFGVQWRVLTRASPTRAAGLPPVHEIVDNVQRGLAGLVFGLKFEAWHAPAAIALFVAALVGVRFVRRRTALAWAAVSCAFVFATASKSGVIPDFHPRYLLFVLPAAALAVGAWRAGAPGLLRRWAPVALVVGASVVGQAAFFDMSWQKSRYDEMMRLLRERARAGDAVVLLNSDQYPLAEYYGPAGAPTWILDNGLWSDDERSEQLAQFSSFAAQASRVWLVKYGWAATPGLRSAIEQQLAGEGVRAYQGEFGDVVATLYARAADGDVPVQPSGARFGDAIVLDGARVRGAVFAPGDPIALDLIWRAAARPAADYTVFVHLRRSDDGAQIAANDSPPSNGAAPTSGWSAGGVITDSRGILIPADAAPGVYRIIVGLYSYPSFDRLAVDGTAETEYVLREVEIVK
jgi:hypothetical protein